MRDIRKSTIDTIMKDYYNCICSDKLLDKNINIDDSLEVENSTQSYIQEFASFLNKSYYRGYVISESIFSKLLDIINYEGYEYKLFNAYQNILLDAMNCYNSETDVEFTTLNPEDAKDFVMEYSKIYDLSEYTLDNVPHYGDIPKPEFLVILNQENYPMDVICKDAISKIKIPEQLAEFSYVLYKENTNAYKYYLLEKNNNLECLFFLLDNTDNDSLDILVSKINSLDKLLQLIKCYDKYSDTKLKFSTIVNNNIRRLIEILTVNMPIEQTAMIIGKNYNEWREYCDNNYHKLSTLLMALNLYQSDPDRFKILDPVEYLSRVKDCYNEDSYFYIRNILLSMDVSLFCNKFEVIYKYIIDALDNSVVEDLITECIDGFVNLRNNIVDHYLIFLHDKLAQYVYSKNNSKVLFKINNNKLSSEIIKDNEINDSHIYFVINIIEKKLLNRNGEFDTNLIPGENSDIGVNYYSFLEGDSIKNNKIYGMFGIVKTGSVFNDIRVVEPLDSSFDVIDEYLDEKFNKCDKETAVFIAKYINVLKEQDQSKLELLLISGDNNNKIKVNAGPLYEGKVFIGLYNITESKFTLANLNVDADNIIYKFESYSKQIENNFKYQDNYIIACNRENRDTYLVENKEYANRVIELSEDFSEDDNCVVLL